MVDLGESDVALTITGHVDSYEKKKFNFDK